MKKFILTFIVVVLFSATSLYAKNCYTFDEMTEYVGKEISNFETDIYVDYYANDFAEYPDSDKFQEMMYRIYAKDSRKNLNDGEMIYYSFYYANYEYIVYNDRVWLHYFIRYRDGFDALKSQYSNAYLRSKYKSMHLQGKSDYKKFVTIYKWVCKTFSYDYSHKYQSDYDAIVNKKCVCTGYAIILKKMCEIAGIDCKCVTGKVGNELHAWNCVKIKNKWYYADSCFDRVEKIKNKNGTFTTNNATVGFEIVNYYRGFALHSISEPITNFYPSDVDLYITIQYIKTTD